MDEPRRFCLDCRYPLVGLRDTRCPECGRLFDLNDPASFSVDAGELVKLYVGKSTVDAHLLKETLLHAGSPATVLGAALNYASGVMPGAFDTSPSVWVGQLDLDHATQIAHEFSVIQKEPPHIEKSAWTCSECNETIEGQFSTCWLCGADRPTGA